MRYPQFTKKQGNALLSPALSLPAKGILAILMLLPEQEITVGQFMRLCKGNETVGGLRWAIAELAEYGAVSVQEARPFENEVITLLPPYTSDATDAVRAYRDKEEPC